MTIGYALTGSFCTLSRAVEQMSVLKQRGFDIIPLMSPAVYETDTRFGTADGFIEQVLRICGNGIMHTVVEAEPIGPKKLIELLIISPCTGNTIGKLANGIYDTCVTMAAKAHLRNRKPILIGVSTNDALAGCAKNIGLLMNYKNFYFIPMRQDDPHNKPFSVVADFSRTYDAAAAALEGRQIQPMLV